MSISHDSTFGANIEPQEVSFSDSFFTPLKECVERIGFKGIIPQESHADVPLVSTQVTCIQGNIYDSLEIGKPLPSLLSLEHVAFAIKPPYNDPPQPLMVDYSLKKSP